MQTDVLSYSCLNLEEKFVQASGSEKKEGWSSTERYGDFIIPAISSAPLPEECLIPTLKDEGREHWASSVPTWHGARSDVLYILINQAQTHKAHARMYACLQKSAAICVYLHTATQTQHCAVAWPENAEEARSIRAR